MGDIDFDELDRAVNSLMGQADTQAERADNTTTPDAGIDGGSQPSQLQENGATVVDNAPSEDTSTLARPTGQAPIVGRRSSGRFMDVIPSGGARAVSPRPAPSAVASREATSLQPVSAPSLSTDIVSSPEPESYEADNNSLQDDAFDDSLSESPALSQPETTPLNSPFLKGVEIDKRPLGAPAVAPSLADNSAMISDAETLTMPDPIDFAGESLPSLDDAASDPWGSEAEADSPMVEEPLQPELSPEVLAVETMPLDQVTAPVTERPAETHVAPEPTRESAPVMQAAPDSVPAITAPLNSGDIKSQYVSVPTDAPEPSAVFEAASQAPEMLNHPQKKKSGWSIVLWIVLMVVVGIAGGVAVWYFLVR